MNLHKLMKRISAVVLILTLLMLAGCDRDTSQADEFELREIIYGISRDFNWNEIGKIMALVHPDYLHNGMYGSELRQLWLNRRGQYQLLSCDVSRVEIEYDRATIYMEMNFVSTVDELSYPEPETYGDTSYFIRDGGFWQIYGNQKWDK